MAGKSDGNLNFDSYENDGIHLPPMVTESSIKSGGYEGSELFDEGYGNHAEEKKSNTELRQRKNANIIAEMKPNVFRKIKSVLLDSENVDVSNKHATALFSITELFVYFSFLALVIALSSVVWRPTNIYMRQIVQDYFIKDVNAANETQTLDEMQQADDIWNYIENRLLVGIYWNDTVEDGVPLSIMNENRYLGKLRLRMLKTHNRSCGIPDCFRREIKSCAPFYSKSAEEKQTIGPANSSAFIYVEASDLHSPDFSTPDYLTYSGGGYVQDLPTNNREEAYSLVQTLKYFSWIDSDTRVVFMDFSTYNEALHILVSLRIYVEMGPFLTINPDYDIKSVSPFPYISFDDYVILTGEAIFCAYVLFFLIQGCNEIYSKRLIYFDSPWNVIDFGIISLSIAYIVVSINFMILIHNKADNIFMNENYVDIREFSEAFILRCDVLSVLSFVCWLKVFKYLGPTRVMSQIVTTLHRSLPEVIALIAVLCFVVLSFSVVAYTLYGDACGDFTRLDGSFVSMIKLLMGDYEYSCMVGIFPVFTHIFVFIFVIIILFLLVNLYLAIVGDCYLTVLDEGLSDRFILVDYFFYCVNQTLYKLKKKKSPKETEVEYHEWKNALQQRGYSATEICASLKRYGVEGFEDFNEEKRERVENDLAINESLNNVFFVKDTKQYFPQFDCLQDSVTDFNAKINGFMYHLDYIKNRSSFHNVDDSFANH